MPLPERPDLPPLEAGAERTAEAACTEAVTPPDWQAIRTVYEDDFKVTTRQIVVRFGITKHALQRRIDLESWTPRKKNKPRSVSRAGLIRRMLEALDRQMRRIEDETIPSERKVTMLASMSRTLANVLQMEQERRRIKTGDGGKGGAAEVTAEMAALREKIASRIEQINQG